MKLGRTICFQTRGGVNHDFGGLDRVTEILADFFEENGFSVYYLAQVKRPDTHKTRQYYLPNEKQLTSKENIEFYNKFIEQKQINIFINQEGNVNLVLPLSEKNKSILYLTTLHFNPNYITEFHFSNKIDKMNIPIGFKKVLSIIFKIPLIKKRAFAHLHRKLENNYHFNCLNCDQFILLSNRFQKDFENLFVSKKLPTNIRAINNPIKINNSVVDFSRKKKKLLYVGRLECGMKKLDTLLNNWNSIAENFQEWSLHLVGGGPDEMMLKQQVLQEGIPRVFFEGIQNPQAYYEEASIFCFSSASSEGWGMVLVEAQMNGCVPLAFNSYSSIADIISDHETGRLVPAYNNTLYTDALIELMQNDALRNKLAINTIEYVKKFDINIIGHQWINLFDELQRTKSQIKA